MGVKQKIMIRWFHNSDLKGNAKKLRNNPTQQERKLWYDFLKNLNCHFVRQKVIGNYIVDFYCAKYKVVIELDGSQHYDEVGEKKDKLRDEYLTSFGLTVLRYSNLEINNNFNGVCQDILKKCGIEL